MVKVAVRTRLVTAVAGMAALSACASTDYGRREVGEAPADKSSAEAGMWLQMDEMEDRLAMSGHRVDDPALDAYMKEILCKVAGDYCGELRVYVMESPQFNASMAPNGMMLVNTGLLLRAETEAQLAFVLAHEFGHYLENHSLERRGAVKNASVTGSILSAGLIAAGAGALADLGYAAPMAGAFAFNRDQEREADRIGLEALGEAGYDTASGVGIWINLRDEVEASTNRKKRRRFNSASLFDTHPLTEERIAYLDQQSAAWPAVETDPAAYRARIRPHLPGWLAAQVAMRDAGSTLHLLDRLAQVPGDEGAIAYARGEVYRFRGEEGDEALALAAYEAAGQASNTPAEAFRQIGDLKMKAGEHTQALAALTTYLEHAPDAADRALVENMIMKLEGEEG
ncbi:MAG: M48 family metalloprotease [Alphaproteobacteria bacterium]|jgi:predicted Zn-dependent protease|nr:M48 family metalloprotease [Alphaproteobacteria bacterium]